MTFKRLVSRERAGKKLLAPEITVLIWSKVRRRVSDAQLSGREQEVLELLLFGRSADEISRALGIAPRTAKFHQANLLKKLGLRARIELPRLFLT